MKNFLLCVWKRALKNPKTTAAGIAGLITMALPHADAAKVLAGCVFVLGLLAADATPEC